MIEDCAQAFGGRYHGRPLGSFGDIAVASFQSNKMITAGEGGLVWTSDEALFARAVRCHDLGFVRPQFADQLTDRSLAGAEGVFAASQYRMSELTGAFLLAQIRRLEGILARCGAYHKRIREALAGSSHFAFRSTGDDDCGITLYLRFPGPRETAEFSRALEAEGIPLGPSSGCVMLPGSAATCPNVGQMLARHVAIGIGPLYQDEDVDDIIGAIRKVERGLYT